MKVRKRWCREGKGCMMELRAFTSKCGSFMKTVTATRLARVSHMRYRSGGRSRPQSIFSAVFNISSRKTIACIDTTNTGREGESAPPSGFSASEVSFFVREKKNQPVHPTGMLMCSVYQKYNRQMTIDGQSSPSAGSVLK